MATTILPMEEVTIGTTATEYVISDPSGILLNATEIPITTSSSNSGTIQFSVGQAPTVEEAVAAGQKRLVINVQNGFRNLWADASGAGQKFTVG